MVAAATPPTTAIVAGSTNPNSPPADAAAAPRMFDCTMIAVPVRPPGLAATYKLKGPGWLLGCKALAAARPVRGPRGGAVAAPPSLAAPRGRA